LEFGGTLRAFRGILLQQPLKEDDERLRDIFELFERQRCVLVLIQQLRSL
jgi:hypothetical protein